MRAAAAPEFKSRYPAATKPFVRKGHWSFDLQSGAFVMKDGVLYEKGTLMRHPLTLAGVVQQPPADLLSKVGEMEKLSLPQRRNLRRRWLEWYAQYVGRSLDARGRSQLLTLYRNLADTVNAFEAARAPRGTGKLSPAEFGKLQTDISRIATEFLIEERRVFGTNTRAQVDRYRKALKPLRLLDDQSRAGVRAEVENFLSGKYLADDEREASASRVASSEFRYRAVPASRTIAYTTARIVPPSERVVSTPVLVNGMCVRKGIKADTVIEGPRVIASEGRVFVADHMLTGNTLEDHGMEGLYHTSIVGGLWEVIQTKVKATWYRCDQGGLTAPVITGAWEQMTTKSEFNRWIVADGCAGSYKSTDELTPVYVFGGEGTLAEQVIRVLRSVRADGDGKRCRTRYAAFPNGVYGVNWVCHQNCNDFAHTKWNILPVHYVMTYSLFFDLGNLGITDISAPCQCHFGSANHACVPGKDCCDNWTFAGGSGWGYGLSVGWHPTKNWIDTEAKFNSHAVPIDGFDTEIVVSMEAWTSGSSAPP
jgi:hypothetical protein